MTQLWVGLGNPEPGMAGQRHNIGFMALDVIATRHGFQPWRRRFKGAFTEGTIAGQKILALKPLTYMNQSGESVHEASAFYKMPVDSIVAFHDELDLAPGKLRVKQGGGAAGHNGLRSMDKMLGNQNYWRVRLGIGHPGVKERVQGHVLGNFNADDKLWLVPMLDAVADAAGLLAGNKHSEFMSKVALQTQDTR